ncbi:hypothetical protein CBS101457_000771 [Exobasidium rhododendri]|nr:hypothetical protein CBS101457_000771 [Exobasidium rhododendri]
MVSSSNNAAPADAGSPSYLRRRSAQQEAASQMSSNAAAGSANMSTKQGVTIRRPSAHNTLASDFPLTLSSLSEHPSPPMIVRSTTPTISANAPLTSIFGKQRVADENQAVANMVASNSIQRPASAPPRGSRSRHTSKELDDLGADLMEAAILDSAPPLHTARSTSSIKDSAMETMQLFTSNLSDRSLSLLFLFIVMWGAVLSLDRLTTYSYQTIATNSFSSHSSLALVNVVRSVIAAVAAVPFAVIADLCGRCQAFAVALVFYSAGHIVMAASIDIPSYVGGVILYEAGANGLVCLQYTVLADMTSSRNRLFFQMMPQMPFLVFSFVSSDIYSAILPRWRWGIAIFAILGPVSLAPVIWILHNSQKGQKGLAVTSTKSLRRASIQQESSTFVYVLRCLQHLWNLADLLGLILLAASLTLILVPLTLAASSPDKWESPDILGMITAGAVLGLLFAYWEAKKASNPLMAKGLLRNWTFWGGATSLCLLWTAHALMIAYFPTYLYVVHNTSNRAQQNISVIYSFTIAASSLPVALVVRYTRRYKIFTLIGVVLFTAGLGLMIGLKGTSDSTFHLVASQIVIGLGGALTIALIQSAVQVSVPHAFVSQSIAALNIFPCVGNAIGAAIAGALWGNLLPGLLIKSLATTGHQSDVGTIYSEPLTWIESYPIGTTSRTAVVDAYSSVWRVMMITATVICAASIVSMMRMKNLKLNDFLSVAEEIDKAEGDDATNNTSKGGASHLFGDRLFEKLENALWKGAASVGIKLAGSDKPGGTAALSSEKIYADETLAEDDDRRLSPYLRSPVKSHLGSETGKSRAGEASDAAFLSSIPPILVLNADSEDEVSIPISAPATLFRPQVSSPLARRFPDGSTM